MMKRPLAFVAVVGLLTLVGLFQVACTTTHLVEANPSSADASTDDDDAGHKPPPEQTDAGVTNTDSGNPFANVYPAPHPDARQLLRLKGPILEHPHIIPIFYGDDADRAKTEALLAQLPGSTYWAGLTEYGVLDVTILPSVIVLPTAPATFSLDDIDTTIAGYISRTTDPAPAPDGTQVYALFFPTQTKVEQGGTAFCDAGGGYHEETMGQPKDFAYAVIPHCSSSFDEFGVAMTHELMEASTDPFPLTNPAWAGTDPNHVGFRLEIGDLCDYNGSLEALGIPLFGTHVERMFSNTRSVKGIDPCLPDLGVAHFGAAPIPQDDIVVNDFVIGQVSGRGVNVPVGKTKTVKLALYSDRKVPDWQVSVQSMDPETAAPTANLTLDLDSNTGTNGGELQLTITRTQANAGGDVVFIYSTSSTDFWTDTIYVGE